MLGMGDQDAGQTSACPIPDSLRGSNLRDSNSASSSCPAEPGQSLPGIFNVYNQRIDTNNQTKSNVMVDPRNNMPVEANQLPYPGQKRYLSTEREVSTIPKGGTNENWVYPSPQMFYNALIRKDKAHGVSEDDMPVVVYTHNIMNELAWKRLLQWEQLHKQNVENVKLRRFTGRPNDLSPLARFGLLLGWGFPFDRHDWFVDRQGSEVRYVIDFYFDDARAGDIDAFQITLRPALDDFQAVLDRSKMWIYEQCAWWGVPCPITGHEPSSTAQEQH